MLHTTSCLCWGCYVGRNRNLNRDETAKPDARQTEDGEVGTKVNLNWLVGEQLADTFFKHVTEAKDKFAGVMKQADAKNKQKYDDAMRKVKELLIKDEKSVTIAKYAKAFIATTVETLRQKRLLLKDLLAELPPADQKAFAEDTETV